MIALDFETSGLTVWSPKTEVISMATAWHEGDTIQARFSDTPALIEADLEWLSRTKQPVCVYNVGFEALVLLCKYPKLSLNIAVDVMRLVQVYDNSNEVKSFGLKPSATRILGAEKAGWEREIREYLIGHGHKPHDYHMAPRDVLRRYNCGDVIATLELYGTITAEFQRIKYDWRFDHNLYLSTAAHIVNAQATGIKTEREGLARYVAALNEELENNAQEFREKYATEIGVAEQRLTAKEQAKFKVKQVGLVTFNVDSNTHRELLFCDIMGIKPKYFTPGGSPSFKAEHLGTYGEPGKHLERRKSRQIVLSQATNLLALSEEDGIWHVPLRLSGTKTGRFSGGTAD